MKQICILCALLVLVCAMGFSETNADAMTKLPLLKEPNVLEFSHPQNNGRLKQQRSRHASALAFIGMLATCIATDAMYDCENDSLHKKVIVSTAFEMGLDSDFAAILSGDASTARRLLTVDNDTIHLLPSEK